MLAFALFVRGDVARRRLVGEYSEQTLEEAVVDLERAESILGQSRRLGHSSANDSVARGCRGALIELGVISGRFTTEEALEQMRGQREATDAGREGTEPKESQGWWSDFEANIAWCGLSGRNRIDTTLEHAERLVEIGAHLEHFGLQDAGFRWLLKIHQASETRAGKGESGVITPPRLVQLVRLMGRLPEFRTTGWRLLDETGALDHAKAMDPRSWRKGLGVADKKRHPGGLVAEECRNAREKRRLLLDLS